MASVTLTPGTLPPPACYPTEQDRFNAYVAAIIATVTGGLQWEVGASAPTDNTLYWLRTDTNGRPLEALKWSVTDGAWVRWLSELNNTATPGGVSNAYTLTNAPSALAPAAIAYRPGTVYVFRATIANTGACTLAVDGHPPVAIKKRVTVDLEANDITTGKIVMLVHDGTNFQMISPERPPAAPYEKATTEILGLPSPGTSASNGHGLTAPAEWWKGRLACVTAEHGYAIGDEIEIYDVVFNFDQAGDVLPDGSVAYKLTFSASSYTLACIDNPSSANTITIFSKTNGTPQTFTPANWKLRVFAARFLP